jgi:hypothetical protein
MTVSERVGAIGRAKGMTALSGACCGMGGPDVGVADGGSGVHPSSGPYSPLPPSAAPICNGGGRWMPGEASGAGVSGVGRRRSTMVVLARAFSGECLTGDAATEGGNAGSGDAATIDSAPTISDVAAEGVMIVEVGGAIGAGGAAAAKAAGRGGW